MRAFVLIITLLMSSFSQADYLAPNAFNEESSPYKALIFLSHKCPCSRSHIEHINSILTKNKDLKIFGVISEPSKGDDKVLSDQYYTQSNFNFPIIEDPQQSLVKEYGALKTPHVTLLKKTMEGKFKVIYQGGLTNQKVFNDSGKFYLAENMENLSHGKPLKYERGFSLGCYIKRIQ